jgi:hypothetical protein
MVRDDAVPTADAELGLLVGSSGVGRDYSDVPRARGSGPRLRTGSSTPARNELNQPSGL